MRDAQEPCLCGDPCCRKCFRGHRCEDCAQPSPLVVGAQYRALALLGRFPSVAESECSFAEIDAMFTLAAAGLARTGKTGGGLRYWQITDAGRAAAKVST